VVKKKLPQTILFFINRASRFKRNHLRKDFNIIFFHPTVPLINYINVSWFFFTLHLRNYFIYKKRDFILRYFISIYFFFLYYSNYIIKKKKRERFYSPHVKKCICIFILFNDGIYTYIYILVYNCELCIKNLNLKKKKRIESLHKERKKKYMIFFSQ